MAKADGSVVIDTLLDTKGFGKGVTNMKSQFSSLMGSVKKLGTAIGIAFGVTALVNFGKQAVELGSDLQEVQNVVDVTFSTMSDKVNQFAKDAAATAGLSETMAKKYAGTFGAMSKSFGFAEQESYDMSTALTQLAGDVASFYNLTQDEAYTKLKSVFTGETETLKDLGVVMTQAALDSFAMAKGYGKTTDAMSEQEKVALRYRFVMEKLSGASGDFLRTSDSWANQVRILKLNVESFMATVGQGLINLFTPVIKLLNTLFVSLNRVAESFKSWTEDVTGKDSVSEEIENAAGGTGDIADDFDDVVTSSKKIKRNLSSLDELRIWESDDSNGISSLENALDSLGKVSIDNPFKTIEKVDFGEIISADIKKIDFKGTAEKLSNAIGEVLGTTSFWIDRVNWQAIGDNIGQFLLGIEWGNLLIDFAGLTIELGSAVIDVATGTINQLFGTDIPTVDEATESVVEWGDKVQKIFDYFILPTSQTGVNKAGYEAMFGEEKPLDVLNALISGGQVLDGLYNRIIMYEEAVASQQQDAHVQAYKNFQEQQEFNQKIAEQNQKTTNSLKESAKKTLEEILSKTIETGYKSGAEYDKNLSNGIIENKKTVTTAIDSIASSITEEIVSDKQITDAEEKGMALGKGIMAGVAAGFGIATSKKGELDFSELEKSTTTAFKTAVNGLLSGIETSVLSPIREIDGVFKKLSGIEVLGTTPFLALKKAINIPKAIPKLATGAVIPPNAPFYAMLGDQKHGTNIEAPLDTIKQALREVLGTQGQGGNTYNITATARGRALFDLILAEGRGELVRTGKNPFDLVTT